MSLLDWAPSPLAILPLSLPWYILAAITGYLLVMWTNPAKAGFRDGARALRRYSALWVLPGLFATAAAIFQLLQRCYFYAVLPPEERPVFRWMRAAWRDPQYWLSGSEESLWWLPHADWVAGLKQSVAPGFESLAGTFNCLVGTFPLSALAALLLLLNRGGHHAVLIRAVRKRCGAWASVVHFAIVICALAALLKPFLYAAPHFFRLAPQAALIWVQWAPVVVWMSFLFEYLFGVFLQTYLILLAYIWVRGLSFTREHLVDFAIRRFSSVAKWAAVILVVSTLTIDLPLILKNFEPFAAWLPADEALASWLSRARLGLALLVVLGATLQITLIFHSESWRDAWRDHRRFLRANAWPVGWFFVVAGGHCWALHGLNLTVARGVGEGTALWVTWTLIFPWLAAWVSGWLLASWVCVYKRGASPHLNSASQTLFKF